MPILYLYRIEGGDGHYYEVGLRGSLPAFDAVAEMPLLDRKKGLVESQIPVSFFF